MADHSAPLVALMNGLMREASEGVAELEDIDEQTFVRFCEYAYTGDYTPTQRHHIPAASTHDQAETSLSTEHFFGTPKKKKGKGTALFSSFEIADNSCDQCGRGAIPKQILWDNFKRRDYLVVSPKSQPSEKLEECDTFLCHARVYVFADKYDIANLRILALDKLHQLLCGFKVAESQMGAIVDLIRYSYSNDNTKDNEAGHTRDSLRSMVAEFAVCHFEIIVKDNSFLELMGEGGYFPQDLTVLLRKRIVGKAT